VSDVAAGVTQFANMLGVRMAKKKLTKAEREELDVFVERALANAQRTREPAERAQAKLDAQKRAEGA
jgi:hypothetical protein